MAIGCNAEKPINSVELHNAEQLITGDGEFRATSVYNFINSVKLDNPGRSYGVVSIMGPQSSGKSTLVNHLFNTSFKEMDASKGRSQTTKGILIAKAPDVYPFTIVMDLEGTDGSERGEDGTLFGKQSALFALAVSDVVLVNLWCHDIGREHAAGRPLLKTIFQVMLHSFDPRRKTLMFVLRDKTKTPLEQLEDCLREDIHKIWEAVQKPQQLKDTSLNDIFNVKVTALSNYEHNKAQFQEQVNQMRQDYFNSTSPIWLADARIVVPASEFLLSAEIIWKTIKQYKDLDLPSQKVMVAFVRCEQIVKDKFDKLKFDKDWLTLEQGLQAGGVSGFGKTVSTLVEKYLSEYDAECKYFDEGTRASKREDLLSKALQLVQPAHKTLMRHLLSNGIHDFQTELEKSLPGGKFAESVRIIRESCVSKFDEGYSGASIEQANWDASEVRVKFLRAVEKHALSVLDRQLSKLTAQYEQELSKILQEKLENYFNTGEPDTWALTRRHLNQEIRIIEAKFSGTDAGFDLDEAAMEQMMFKFKTFAWQLVEDIAKSAARNVLNRMKERFYMAFNFNRDCTKRVWTAKVDITAIAKDARNESLKVLAMLAVIRRDEGVGDNVEELLLSTFNGDNMHRGGFGDPLASNEWDEVPKDRTLITPVECKNRWIEFLANTQQVVNVAFSTQMVMAAEEAATAAPSVLRRFWNSGSCLVIQVICYGCLAFLVIAVVIFIRTNSFFDRMNEIHNLPDLGVSFVGNRKFAINNRGRRDSRML